MTWLMVMAALRAVLEMALWLMLGRGVLALLAGSTGSTNGVLRLFDFLLRPVRTVSVCLFPRVPACRRESLMFLLLLLVWLSLGIGKFFLVAS